MEAPQTSSADFKGPLRSLLKFKHFDGFPTACFSKALKCFIIDTADFFFFFKWEGRKACMELWAFASIVNRQWY